MVSKKLRGIWMVAFLMALISARVALGQAGGGSITGMVYDPAGAVIPHAEISLISGATGVRLTTTSTSAGQFVFPVVPVGEYALTVSASGFQQVVMRGVSVALNQTTAEKVVLKVGATTTTVQVSASTVHLNTTSAQATTGIDEQTYSRLPIAISGAARSPTIVADLMPGVADSPGASSAAPSGAHGQTFSDSIEGGQSFGYEVLYDGVALAQTNIAGDLRVQPVPVEALSEFTLVQNIYNAKYGRTPGGVFSFNTRSGTNQWHGEAYEFNENTSFDARGFFAPNRAVLRQNEFGVNVGGPIRRNRTFVFGYYSGFRYNAAPEQGLATIPTAAERNGDFSQYTVKGHVVPIYDPATTACNGLGICTRQQFPGNMIASNRIVSVAKAFFPYIPAPSNSNEINNFVPLGAAFGRENRFGAKLDHYFSDRDIIHAFYGQSPYTSQAGIEVYALPFISSNADILPDDYLIARLSEDHTFSPTLLNHATLGFNRDNFSYTCPTTFSNETLGVKNVVPHAPYGITWTGYEEAGCLDPGQLQIENGFVLDDFLAWVKGRHDITMGVDYEWSRDNTLPYSAPGYNFSYRETDLPSAANPAATGNGFASFLLGEVDSAAESYYINETGNRFKYLGTYIEDSFKVKPQLTLNLGLRYDIPWTRTALYNILSSFDPNMPNPGAGGRLGALAFAGYGPDPYCNCERFDKVRYNGFQPRFGFAYAANSKTVVRGGFGIFDDSNADVLENGNRNTYSRGFNADPFFSTSNLGVTPAFNIENGFPSFRRPPIISASYDNNSNIWYLAPQDGTVGFIENWSLDVQRSLPDNFLLGVGYYANSGHHLSGRLLNPNQLNPKYLSLGNALNAPVNSMAGQAAGVALPYAGFTGTVAQALLPYPQYLAGAIGQQNQADANSHYNSLQAKLQRRFSNGLSVLVSYTYSKLMTQAEEGESWYAPYGGGAQNSYDLAAEMSPSGIDPPQILKISYVYNLPVGKGKRFLNHSGVASAVLGGWQVSGIQAYQSGTPLAVRVPNSLPLGNYSLRPNIVAGASLKANYSGSFDPATDVYINAGAFATPAPFTFGNAARTLPLRGPAYYNEDIGLTRHFRFKERWDLGISANAFNLFNRVTFGSPDTFNPVSNPDFGHISSQINSPRIIQLEADLHF